MSKVKDKQETGQVKPEAGESSYEYVTPTMRARKYYDFYEYLDELKKEYEDEKE